MYLTIGKLFAVLTFSVLLILPFSHKGRKILSVFFGEKILGQFFEAFETKDRIKEEFEDSLAIVIAVITLIGFMYLLFTIIFSITVLVAYPVVLLILLVTGILNEKLNNK